MVEIDVVSVVFRRDTLESERCLVFADKFHQTEVFKRLNTLVERIIVESRNLMQFVIGEVFDARCRIVVLDKDEQSNGADKIAILSVLVSVRDPFVVFAPLYTHKNNESRSKVQGEQLSRYPMPSKSATR
ncbi:hypothetical protein [Clavibacter sp.]|uniref:hypothetical protein n=1 Tax=Clavibacter sp. TaxID=1871044 RepID=UPI0019C56793|nr:hypothetical protein [Clavibacter sp.]MBD5381976.1 hypothetical protein [Clavibacter sp.]